VPASAQVQLFVQQKTSKIKLQIQSQLRATGTSQNAPLSAGPGTGIEVGVDYTVLYMSK